MVHRHPRLFIALTFAVMLLYVPLYGLYSFGVKTVFGFFAHDAFYYLTVAKHSSLLFFSFDGERATNGFHPLWQWILTAVFAGIGNPDSTTQLYVAYLIGALLVTLGYICAGWSLYRVTRSVYWPLLLIPGPFAVLFTVKIAIQAAQGVTYTYSPWAFMNGMESPCSVALGGLFLLLLTRNWSVSTEPRSRDTGNLGDDAPSDRSVLALGAILSLVVLARLDDVFLVVSTALYFLVLDRKSLRPLKRAFLVVLPTGIAISAYLGFNYAYSKLLFPVSGSIKGTSGAALTGNLAMSLCDLFPFLRGMVRSSYNLHDWGNTAARSSAMILPMIFSVWMGAHLLRSKAKYAGWSGTYGYLLPIVFYIIIKALYNLINVRLGSQGYWYYTLAVFMTNYLVLVMLWETVPWNTIAISTRLKHMCVGVYVCFYLFTAAQTIYLGSFVDKRFYTVWRDRQEITSALKRVDPHVKMIDRSDGNYSYALGIPAVCALGYAIDKEGYEAMRNDRFLEYCLARGFNVTFQQSNAYPLPEGNYTFETIYEHKPSGAIFVRIVPGSGR